MRMQSSTTVTVAPSPRLRECPACGLFQRIPALPRGAAAQCVRCHTILHRHRIDPYGRALALAITGLLMFALASQMPFLDLELVGNGRTATLVAGPEALRQQGLWELSVVVLATTVAAPAAKLAATIWVLACLNLRNPPRHLPMVFRWVEWLSPWSMIEVFLLGVFVAYTKLQDIAHVHVGTALYALGAVMLAMAAMDAVLDRGAVWDAMERKGLTASPMTTPRRGPRMGCDCCGYVTHGGGECPRCGEPLHRRKPDSIMRTWALLIAAAILYIPANMLPVMTVVSFGQGAPSTIVSGVQELALAGMWPLALLVFFASITVPVLKLVSLSILLISTQRGARSRLRERTLLYRIVDAIGRWSMIDVFMISILTALVRMGRIASIVPGPGVVSFCAVVILTMFAAMSFDPRLMWDAAEGRKP
jgi:paraquat-inducible protein A